MPPMPFRESLQMTEHRLLYSAELKEDNVGTANQTALASDAALKVTADATAVSQPAARTAPGV